jgi:hypothetical protein
MTLLLQPSLHLKELRSPLAQLRPQTGELPLHMALQVHLDTLIYELPRPIRLVVMPMDRLIVVEEEGAMVMV